VLIFKVPVERQRFVSGGYAAGRIEGESQPLVGPSTGIEIFEFMRLRMKQSVGDRRITESITFGGGQRLAEVW